MTDKIIISSNGQSLEIYPKQLDIENLKKNAIQSANKLLEIEDIAYIIYVDDKFDDGSQKEEYKARLIKLKVEENYISSEIFSAIDWSSPIPRFEDQIVALWDGTDDKRNLLYEVCTHIVDEESANVIPALDIENYFGAKIKLMTPDEWFQNEYELIKALEGSQKALCLFDFEFHSGNELLPGKNGAHLAKNLIDQEELSEKIVCGIFSHKFTEIQEEEYRLKYAKDYTIELSKFYTISKFRFAFDPKISAFVEGLKNLLLNPYVEKLKNEALEVLKESNTKASEKINEISPKTFNQVIQKSSLKEGVWEISTLFRLYGILTKTENFNTISDPEKRKGFNNDINKIREIDLVETGYKSTSENQQLIDIRNKELYFSNDIINRLHFPNTNGDIFKINDKEYILLVQPCNLALRAKGAECGKRDYDYNNGILIPLKHIKKDKLKINHEEVKVGELNDDLLVAHFPDFQTISMSILDLVVFNENGKAIIDLNSDILNNDVIHFPWKKRYEYIHKFFLNYENKIKEFDSLEEIFNSSIFQKTEERNQFKALKKKKEFAILAKEIGVLKKNFLNTKSNILDIEDLKKLKIDCSKIYNAKTRTIDITIERMRHYKSPYSDDLLQKFMLYLSRNAFDHDFTS